MFRVTTCLKEAERLYHQFCPSPKSTWMSWEARLALYDPPNDLLYFLHTDTSLIPLQIVVPISSFEWFGGWLIEGQPWWVSDSLTGQELMKTIVPFNCELDQTEYLKGVTVPSRLPTYRMPMPHTWEDWKNGLDKKRRWELKQADSVTCVELLDQVSAEQAELLCQTGIALSISSWKARGKPDDCIYTEPHFIRAMSNFVKWLAGRKKLQAAIRRVNQEILGIAFGFLDINDEYVWLFSAANIEIASSLGKALLSDIVKLAVTTDKKTINACADDVGKMSVKYHMGFRAKPSWVVRKSCTNWENSEGLDPANDWIGALTELYGGRLDPSVVDPKQAFKNLVAFVDERNGNENRISL